MENENLPLLDEAKIERIPTAIKTDTVVSFGAGAVGIGHGCLGSIGLNCVRFMAIAVPKQIGILPEGDWLSPRYEGTVVLKFDNIGSIDVVITALQWLKRFYGQSEIQMVTELRKDLQKN